MKQADLTDEFNKHTGHFEMIKNEIETKTVRTENYIGEFYEISPFSYQRGGFKQGKLIEEISKLKIKNGIFTYSFNETGNIIEIREGIELKNKFNYQFFFHEENKIKSLSYNYDFELQNISYYLLNNKNKIISMFSKGKMGGCEEKYKYNNNKLEKITIRQFDRNGIEGGIIYHNFEYDNNGRLIKITKANDIEIFDVIYELK